MAKPRVLILRAPGTNCDAETAFAFAAAGAEPTVLHVGRLVERPALAGEFQVLCIPGGFSYGDDLSAGRILASQIRGRLEGALQEFRDADKLILGICNGFQVLIKTGLLLDDLPGGAAAGATGSSSASASISGATGCLPASVVGTAAATLTWNDSGRFTDRWVHLVTCSDRSVFLRGIERMYLPIAHAEGKFVPHDAAVLKSLDAAGQLVLRYATPEGRTDEVPFPFNPNGAALNTAGVCDPTGRVLGLMPHPERHIDPTQHPRWTRGEAGNVGDGLRLFENAVGYFR